MSNRSIRTTSTRARFLEALGEYGNVTAAAAVAGTSRNPLYAWRRDDPEFHSAWEAALELGICGLEDEAKRRAVEGKSDQLLMFIIKRYRPEYRERQTVDLNATATQDIRKVSDEELQRQLRELLDKANPFITGTAVELVEPPQTKLRGG